MITMEQLPGITQQRKRRLWFGAWAAAAVATTIGAPTGWAFFWLFPICSPPVLVLRFLSIEASNEIARGFVLLLGWMYYLGLTIWGLGAYRRKVFNWAFTILCLSLLLNCAGCQSLLHFKLKC